MLYQTFTSGVVGIGIDAEASCVFTYFGGSTFLETFLEEVLTSFALFALAFGFDVLATFF